VAADYTSPALTATLQEKPMRTYLFLGAGVLMLAASCILGKLFSETYPTALAWSTGLFIVVWCALAALNLFAGVTRAGYGVAEELPIFLLIAGIPVVAMIVLRWKVL
jgi:hypothetical protein